MTASHQWQVRFSHGRKKPYYLNLATKESRWDYPDAEKGLVVPSEEGKAWVRHLLVKHNESRKPSSRLQSTITRTRDEAIKRVLELRGTILAAASEAEKVRKGPGGQEANTAAPSALQAPDQASGGASQEASAAGKPAKGKEPGEQQADTAAPPTFQALDKAFSEAAQEASDCSSGVKGGDLGLFERGQMQKAFEEAAYALPIGTMSQEAVLTDSGVHILLRLG